MGLVRRSRGVLGEVVEAIISSQRRDSGMEAETPASEPASEPVSEPASEPSLEPSLEPVSEPASEPVSESMTEPTEQASGSSEQTSSPGAVEMSRSQAKLEVQRKMKETLQILRDDIGMQRRLDEVLRAGIVGSCGNERLMMGLPSRSERLCLRRFVGFVEGRVTELGGAYARVEKAVGSMERAWYETLAVK
ncbi:hypothetical protein DID88_001224 [Monilinia fructigena]|uniref:Uncharacterized protein n=1 Tax=Monilinia fructigena TaxID=38457 RepID=A0A395IZ82_9HELO|nr:hypothetical protein DID88_001224 [Monilinia fructigena]